MLEEEWLLGRLLRVTLNTLEWGDDREGCPDTFHSEKQKFANEQKVSLLL